VGRECERRKVPHGARSEALGTQREGTEENREEVAEDDLTRINLTI